MLLEILLFRKLLMHMDHMINQGKMINQLDLFFDVKIKNWSRLEGYGLYCKLANETWSMHSKKKGSLSIRLTDNKEIRYFNKKWRNKDLATNVQRGATCEPLYLRSQI